MTYVWYTAEDPHIKKSKGDHWSEKALGRVAASEGPRSPPRGPSRGMACVSWIGLTPNPNFTTLIYVSRVTCTVWRWHGFVASVSWIIPIYPLFRCHTLSCILRVYTHVILKVRQISHSFPPHNTSIKFLPRGYAKRQTPSPFFVIIRWLLSDYLSSTGSFKWLVFS